MSSYVAFATRSVTLESPTRYERAVPTRVMRLRAASSPGTESLVESCLAGAGRCAVNETSGHTHSAAATIAAAPGRALRVQSP